jgi:lipid-A-disaccharide synthase
MAARTPILISAIESSGDDRGASLVRAVREERPEVEFEGFGGPKLAAAGCRVRAELVGHASMVLGFLGHAHRYLGALRAFDRLLREVDPAAVILVDSPGFHFLLARLAKWRGVPVIYYVCPQIWAWAPWRRARILRYTDLLLSIMPFEEKIYQNPRVPVKFVGHTLGDELASFPRDAGERLRRLVRIEPGEKVIGVLPGSRAAEVKGLMPIFRQILDGMRLDPERHAVMVSCHRKEFEPVIEAALRDFPVPSHVLREDSKAIAMASDLLLATSGTATLEAAYFGRPMLVIYRTHWVGHFFFRHYVLAPYFALPNLLGASLFGGEPTVPERLCRGDEGLELAREALDLLESSPERERMLARLAQLKERFLLPGASERAAAELLRFLDARAARADGGRRSRPL